MNERERAKERNRRWKERAKSLGRERSSLKVGPWIKKKMDLRRESDYQQKRDGHFKDMAQGRRVKLWDDFVSTGNWCWCGGRAVKGRKQKNNRGQQKEQRRNPTALISLCRLLFLCAATPMDQAWPVWSVCLKKNNRALGRPD